MLINLEKEGLANTLKGILPISFATNFLSIIFTSGFRRYAKVSPMNNGVREEKIAPINDPAAEKIIAKLLTINRIIVLIF